MKILVLGGGTSPEREISLQSSRTVVDALKELGHEPTYVDPVEGDDAVLEAAIKAEVVLPILHGAGGEDGQIQALLDRTGKPYLGSGVEAAQRSFDKVVFKQLLLEHRLPTADFQIVTAETIASSHLMSQPFVLKPINGGSSIDLVIERQPNGIDEKIKAVFGRHHELLMEHLIDGIEITVPILGDEALPVIEIVPPTGESFDFANKYNGETAEIVPAKNVSREKQAEAQELALKIHKLIGARHLSRTDMIIDRSGKLWVLELNTIPGVTPESLYPKGAAAADLSYTQMVARFVELATKSD